MGVEEPLVTVRVTTSTRGTRVGVGVNDGGDNMGAIMKDSRRGGEGTEEKGRKGGGGAVQGSRRLKRARHASEGGGVFYRLHSMVEDCMVAYSTSCREPWPRASTLLRQAIFNP